MLPLSWVRGGKAPEKLRRCLFLDRDGVINEHIKGGYVLRWSDFVWRPGAIAALRDAAAIGLPMIVVSNQSCIGRGLASRDQIAAIMHKAVSALDEVGARIDGWYCCPHVPEDGCSCRKPAPGMLLTAAMELNVDLATSYMIGDSITDVAAGQAVGCATWFVDRSIDFSSAIRDISVRERLIATTCEATSW